ncbi:MAG: DUF6602 domain-containing protein [Actinomycetota bacterium]
MEHQATKGAENEAALIRLLEGLIPRRFAADGGLLIDSTGRQSPQMDVAIRETSSEASLFGQTTEILLPIESVFAVIEVKTTLTAGDIEDFGSRQAATNQLQASAKYEDGTTKPLSCLFAYSSWAKAPTVLKHLEQLDSAVRPDLVFIATLGLVAGRQELLSFGATDFVGGVTPLNRIEGGSAEPVIPEEGTDSLEFEGHRYQVDTTSGRAIDPSRALLLFLESMLRSVHSRSGAKPPIMSAYLGSELRQIDEVS